MSMSSFGSYTPSASDTPDEGQNGPAKPKKKKKFSMAFIPQEELENVRVQRLPGMPEWGAPSTAQDMPVKGHRKEDRWV